MKMMSMAVMAVLLAFASAANATLLISDTFNTVSSYSGSLSTVLNNEISGRQSGSLTSGGTTTVDWYYADHFASTAGLNTTAAYVTATDSGSGKMPKISLNHNFTDSAIITGGGFIINLRVDPVGTTLAFGGTNAGNRTSAVDKSDFTRTPAGDEWDYLLNLNDGTWSTGTGGTGTTTGSGTFSYTGGSSYINAQVEVTTTGFSSGTGFAAKLTIDGGSVLSTYNGTWDADGQNYIAIGKRGSGTTEYYDSFSVSSIPEPATLSMIGVVGIAMLLRRRIVRG